MRPRLLLLLLLAVPMPASAQCQLCSSDEKAEVAAKKTQNPLRVEVETELDMGRFAVGAMGGEVELDPVTGARRLRGAVTDLGGFAVTGRVIVTGDPGAPVRVILPTSVDLQGDNGRSARVVGLATDLSAAPRLGADGRLQFRFGGRLQVEAGGAGDYRGRIPVTVEYE